MTNQSSTDQTTAINAAFAFLGDQTGLNKKNLGDIANLPSDLPAPARANLVAALSHVIGVLQSRSEIDDTAVAANSGYSSEKIETRLTDAMNALKNELLGGASPEFDTLKEIAEDIQQNEGEILALLAKRVRVDQAQSFSADEKATARSNIGAASQSDQAALASQVTTVEATAQAASTQSANNAAALEATHSNLSAVATTANAAASKANGHDSQIADLGTQLNTVEQTANATKATADDTAAEVAALKSNLGDAGNTDFLAAAQNAYNAASQAA